MPAGLGLSDGQVDELTDFLENALYDPALVQFDPDSPTRTLEPNEEDLTYSKYRPDLAALGARDGRMPSGLPRSNDDALSRRDMGLEFLDVTNVVTVTQVESNQVGAGRQEDVYRITNNTSAPVDTHLLLIVRGVGAQVQLENGNGRTSNREPYQRLFLPDGVLMPGQSITTRLLFRQQPQLPSLSYGLTVLSGQGTP